MKKKEVEKYLKDRGFKTTGGTKSVVVRQEDGFLRVSLQAPAFTLNYDEEGHSTKLPTGAPSRAHVKNLLAGSDIEKTQPVQVDYEIAKGEYSAHWKKPVTLN